MIYLVHGEDIVSSKNFLLKFKESYSSVDTVSLKNAKNLNDVLPTGKGLFSEKKLVVLESFPLKKDLKLSKNLDYDVLLWFGDSITVPNWVDKNWYFKQNQSISSFKLVDYVFYGQEKQALEILRDLLRDTKEREMIVGSLVRQMRLLALAINGEVAEVSKSEFLREKIKNQAKNWNFRKIRAGLIYLLKTDLWLKQGKLSSETLLTNLTINLCRLSNSS